MKNKLHNLPGFTVLEFLIVLSMIVLLMGVVLMGLNNSRSHTRDQIRMSNIKKIEIGLAQFYQICRNYPQSLYSSGSSYATCPELAAQGKSIKDFIPDLDSFDFDPSRTSVTNTGYKYVPLTFASGETSCTGYHIGVALEEVGNSNAVNDSQFDSTSSAVHPCNGTFTIYPFNGNQTTGTTTSPLIFDHVVNY